MLNFNGERTLDVIKSTQYDLLGIFDSTVSYSIGEIKIWGGRVWECDVAGISNPVDNFNLDTSRYTLLTDAVYYEQKSFDIVFSEENSIIIETRDDRGNVVKTTDQDYHINSDWGDLRLKENKTHGFVNNDYGYIFNNICGIISNNLSRRTDTNQHTSQILNNNIGGDISDNTTGNFRRLEIWNNRISGDIKNNLAPDWMDIKDNVNNGSIEDNTAGLEMYILNNSNNGSIVKNTSIADVYIQNNINNGDIGDTGFITSRDRNVEDVINNK